jgi:hypothetical protein
METLQASVAEAQAKAAFKDPDGFVKKLARDQRWSVGYARRVFHEYIRFTILATYSREISPPSSVDKAWHQHITDTQAYPKYCEALNTPFLHHKPSRGTAEERDELKRKYNATFQRYQETFGRPPKDIWPRPKQPKPLRAHRKSWLARFWAWLIDDYSISGAVGVGIVCVCLMIWGDDPPEPWWGKTLFVVLTALVAGFLWNRTPSFGSRTNSGDGCCGG